MTAEEELKKQFSVIKFGITQVFRGEVLEVDTELKTIKIKDDFGIEHPEVRLTASIDSLKKVVQFPKAGSSVLVGVINNDEMELFVVAFSEIESFSIEILDVRFEVNYEGFLLKKENETLKKLMADLITLIKNMKFQVTTPDTINGTTTTLLTDFSSIENRFNNLLK